MADDFKDHIQPVPSSARVDGMDGQRGGPVPVRRSQSIAGRVVTVHRGKRHHDGQHALDVTVGADDYTEIIVRVPKGSYSHLEGKRVVLYLDE